MKPIKKHILSWSLLLSIIYLTLSDGYTALHSLKELPSTLIEEFSTYDSSDTVPLLSEKRDYEIRGTHDLRLFPVLEDRNALGSTYVVERTSHISHMLNSTHVKSELGENTIIRNKQNTYINPSDIGIEAATDENIKRAKKKFRHPETGIESEKIQVFEFGIVGEHLIFSQPVKVSVDVPGFDDGIFVKVSVLHEGEADFGTLGLTDESGQCNPDGSATKNVSDAQVLGGMVTFYTCGASTFAVGVPQTVHLPNSTVWTMTEQSDESIIIGGAFTTVGGYPRGRLARLLSGGTIDTSFSNPNINNIVYATALQSDGKIVVGGAFTGVNGTTRNFLARMNTDGTLDTTFTPNLNNQVRTIAVLPDDSILIGGTFTTSSGTARNRMLKFSSTGGLIGSFTPNFNNSVFVITPEPSGNILVGGQFTTMSGTTRNRVVRLSATGGITSFNPNMNNIVQDIKLYSDASMLIAGQFTSVSGIARTRLAKISATGGLISSFSIGSNGTVNTINVQADDSTIIGGAFTTLSGVARSRIAQISSTGVLDTDFNPNSNNTVYKTLNDGYNNIIAGGAFTTMSGMAAPYFVWIGLYDGDVTGPQILSGSMISGSLLPLGNFSIRTNFTDTGGGIDTNSIYATLEKWDGAVWEPDTHALYLSGTPLITSATGIYTFSGVPYGKYLYSLHVPDVWGNETIYETTFYIDDIEWELGTDIVDIGNILPNIQKNSSGSTSSGEMVIIVRTVGAGFNITMTGSSFSSGTSTNVPHWDGSNGYGYERYNGGYTGTLSAFSGATILVAQGANINTDGDRNTYTYSIQYGTLVDMMQLAGDYRGTANFTLNLNY